METKAPGGFVPRFSRQKGEEEGEEAVEEVRTGGSRPSQQAAGHGSEGKQEVGSTVTLQKCWRG